MAGPSRWLRAPGATPLRGGAAALVAGVLLACASAAEPSDPPAPAPAPEPREPAQVGAALEVSGRVVVVGSDPHVLLVVVTEAGTEYELVGELAAELWDLQQRRVRVRGEVVQQAYGPGFPARLEVDEYTLPGSGDAGAAGGR